MNDLVKRVACVVASRVEDHAVIGLGTGSTAACAIECIGERIRNEGISVCGLATSHQTAMLAEQVGITVLNPMSQVVTDWAFDGADEVDSQLNLIKGAGGAMLNEKIMAKRSKNFVIIVVDSKIVSKLGTRCPVPVEVIPEAYSLVSKELHEIGASSIKLRSSAISAPVFTEHMNYIVDVEFDEISMELESRINNITGVVENGLFLNFDPEVLVASPDGVWSMKRKGDRIERVLICQ